MEGSCEHGNVHEIRLKCWLTEKLPASHEAFCSTRLELLNVECAVWGVFIRSVFVEASHHEVLITYDI